MPSNSYLPQGSNKGLDCGTAGPWDTYPPSSLQTDPAGVPTVAAGSVPTLGTDYVGFSGDGTFFVSVNNQFLILVVSRLIDFSRFPISVGYSYPSHKSHACSCMRSVHLNNDISFCL